MDFIWASAIGIGATTIFFNLENISLRSYLIIALIIAWSWRLSKHLIVRILKGKEDRRYVNLIGYLGNHWKVYVFFFFMFQILLSILFISCANFALLNLNSLIIFDLLFFLLGFFALSAESIADNQLKNFLSSKKNSNAVCKIGLWRYSRHPNYFFEWIFWCAIAGFSIGTSFFYFSIAAPILMYLFLRYFTGVPFAEKSSLSSKGNAYRIYQNETSIFFPKRPKKIKP